MRSKVQGYNLDLEGAAPSPSLVWHRTRRSASLQIESENHRFKPCLKQSPSYNPTQSITSTLITILGIVGSLAKTSYNRGALRAAQQLAPTDTKIEIFDLNGIPPYNQDEDARPSEKVTQFKANIRAAAAILISTPEYNYSFPGVMKNTID